MRRFETSSSAVCSRHTRYFLRILWICDVKVENATALVGNWPVNSSMHSFRSNDYSDLERRSIAEVSDLRIFSARSLTCGRSKWEIFRRYNYACDIATCVSRKQVQVWENHIDGKSRIRICCKSGSMPGFCRICRRACLVSLLVKRAISTT